MRKTIVALATTGGAVDGDAGGAGREYPARAAISADGHRGVELEVAVCHHIWFSRKETETAYRKVLVIGGTATLTTYICGLIPQKLAEWVCKIMIPVKATDLLQNVTEAHRRKVCLTATNNVLKAPGNLDFNDNGGSRCK